MGPTINQILHNETAEKCVAYTTSSIASVPKESLLGLAKQVSLICSGRLRMLEGQWSEESAFYHVLAEVSELFPSFTNAHTRTVEITFSEE